MRTPKANLRQERINETRPGLVFKDFQSLMNTIPEDSESQFTNQNSIANDTIEFMSSEK